MGEGRGGAAAGAAVAAVVVVELAYPSGSSKALSIQLFSNFHYEGESLS
jgi:hypothetical protein